MHKIKLGIRKQKTPEMSGNDDGTSGTGSDGAYCVSLYHEMRRKRMAIITALLAAVAVLFFLNITINMPNYTFAETVHALFNREDSPKILGNLVHMFRVPEALFALLVGFGLGMAGTEMQTILNNPLAEPYTLGISMSAAFGASLVIGLGIGVTVFGQYSLLLMAFLMAMVACGVIYVFSSRPRTTRTTIVLLGVALLFLFQALVNLVQCTTDPTSALSITFWMFGSLSRYNDTEYIIILAAVVILVGLFFAMNNWKLTAMKMGDEKVASLGINVKKIRKNMIVGVSLVTAVCVSFTGTIGFIGLVGPHVARMLVGDDQRYLLPLSGICGALFLLLASVTIRAFQLNTLPIGVVTALVGVPFFLFLILRHRGAEL